MDSAPSASESAELVRALVAAYPRHVASRLARLDIEPGDVGLDAVIAAGGEWLAAELAKLVAAPFPDQSRAPLEVFQEAMRFPTESLEEAGVPPVERDPVVAAALPGDRYGLAPASSRELGEEVWRAHLAWGAAKARVMTRPAIGLLSSDLMDRSRVEAAVTSAGFELVVWVGAAALDDSGRPPVRAFVDLSHRDADEAIRSLAAAGVRVVAFGPHVDDLAMVRARALGAADALPRSRFFRILPKLLPTLT